MNFLKGLVPQATSLGRRLYSTYKNPIIVRRLVSYRDSSFQYDHSIQDDLEDIIRKERFEGYKLKHFSTTISEDDLYHTMVFELTDSQSIPRTISPSAWSPGKECIAS